MIKRLAIGYKMLTVLVKNDSSYKFIGEVILKINVV
jgi:hypothetical protein